MAEPAADAIRYKGILYPIKAWRIIYDYITTRKAPDAEFTRRLATLGLTRTEAYELYRAQMWRPWEIKFIKIAPPEEEWVSDESITGYDIYYRFTPDKKYPIRDEKKALVRVETKICMELTASIKTSGGHDVPVVVEITCTTYVKEKGLTEIIEAERKVNKGLQAWLLEHGWGAMMKAYEKVGVSYSGEHIIEERGWYTWSVPDFPKVHVVVEKKKPRARSYDGQFKVEE